MRLQWDGHYLDGETASRHDATVEITQHDLRITTQTHGLLVWPLHEIRQTQGIYEGEHIRLERGGDIPEVVLLTDPEFLTILHRVAQARASHFHRPIYRRKFMSRAVLAGVVSIVLLIGLYVWGIPAFARVVTAYVPPSWETQLGESLLTQLAPSERQCHDETAEQSIDAIVQSLLLPLSNPTYEFQVVVVENPAVNAFALPGGSIVAFQGLLEMTESAEELAGVLAHEVQHILKRHSMRKLLEHASMGVLVAVLTGDASGLMAFGVEAARTMGSLAYNRETEEEADTEGMRMLIAAGIDPRGMIAFFEKLEEDETKMPGLVALLSTHPSSANRIARLQRLADAHTVNQGTVPLDHDWEPIRTMCRGTDQRNTR